MSQSRKDPDPDMIVVPGAVIKRVSNPFKPVRRRIIELKPIEPCEDSECEKCEGRKQRERAVPSSSSSSPTKVGSESRKQFSKVSSSLGRCGRGENRQRDDDDEVELIDAVEPQSQIDANVVNYSVLFAKASGRKHKIWEEDGFLVITNGKDLVLKHENGKVVEQCSNYKLPEDLSSGTVLKIGSKEVQLQDICDSCKVGEDDLKSVEPVHLKQSKILASKPFMKPGNRVSVARVDRRTKEGFGSMQNDKADGEEDMTDAVESQSLTDLHVVNYSVLFAKASGRKNKIWEEDGFLAIKNGKDLILKNESGKIVEQCSNYKLPEDLSSGTVLKIGSKEVQLIDICDSCEFEVAESKSAELVPLKQSHSTKTLTSKPFMNPCAPGTFTRVDRGSKDASKPLFDPNEPGAFLLPEPALDHQNLYNRDGLPVVPVVVDPHISRKLRPHQRQGVEFLYKAVYLNPDTFGGAILADEMGLGKTLQCIALIWTLHRQGPYGRKEIAKRTLIVTPSSLVKNWEKEFLRWLGNERMRVYAVDSNSTLEKYTGNVPVIIISYEMAVRCEALLKTKKIDLMICDEAHKIKNPKNQAYQMLKNLACPRRVLLTGTPVQNDLMELYSLVDFARPGALGTEMEFKREYVVPIAKSYDENCSGRQRGIAVMQAGRLNAEISPFFLRRDSSVMLKYMPGRVTQIVFCKPSSLQRKLYRAAINSNVAMSCLSDSCQSPLAVILLLKKLCNHPYLVHAKNQTSSSEVYDELLSIFPSGLSHQRINEEDSGKVIVLMQLLRAFKTEGHKVVLVSHYTKTLNVLEDVCKSKGFSIVRMDGTTPQKDRMSVVEKFNSSKEPVVFLLSSKAGGVGLNLQASSKIILFDIDWNPAHDIQAMARCWRPGQRNETHIYRLLTSGTIEERIYQRQISKQDVSGSVVDLILSSNNIKFSPDELKDIFTFYEDGCLTHDVIGCDCEGNGGNVWEDSEGGETQDPPSKKRKIDGMGELYQWEHFSPPLENSDMEPALKNDAVDFIFRNKSAYTCDGNEENQEESNN